MQESAGYCASTYVAKCANEQGWTKEGNGVVGNDFRTRARMQVGAEKRWLICLDIDADKYAN